MAFKKQDGGTCWFHALFNGFIHSYNGRKFLNIVFKENGIPKNDTVRVDMCPKPNNLDPLTCLELLYKYTHETGISNNNTSQFIKNSNDRGLDPNFIDKIYILMFPEYRKDIVIMEPLEKNINTLTLKKQSIGDVNKKQFILSHSYISIRSPGKSGHAISGCISKDNVFYIIDSNGYIFKCKWNTNDGLDLLKTHYITFYGGTKGDIRVIVRAVYINEAVILGNNNTSHPNIIVHKNLRNINNEYNMLKIKNGKLNGKLNANNKNSPKIKNAKNARKRILIINGRYNNNLNANNKNSPKIKNAKKKRILSIVNTQSNNKSKIPDKYRELANIIKAIRIQMTNENVNQVVSQSMNSIIKEIIANEKGRRTLAIIRINKKKKKDLNALMFKRN